MPDGIDDPRQSAEGELALARIALVGGDLHHAADHVGGALAYAPDLPAVHEALAQLTARAGGAALDLFPIDGRVFVGTMAARAHLMAAAGDLDEAIDLLARASRHAPTLPWANVAWVADPGLAARLNPDHLFRSLIAVVGAIPDPVPDELTSPLSAYLRLAERAVAVYPGHAVLLGVCSALARKMDRVDWALSWAGRALAVQPSTMTEMWLGYAQQRAGRTDEAVASLRRAMVHDPMNFSLHADAANWLAEAGRIADALQVAEEALAVDPDHDCAYQVACRLRFARDGDVAHLVDIADYLRAHPDQPHEHTDLAAGCGSHAWLGQIPSPSEACVNAMRQVLAAEGPLTGGTLRLSDLEPPSALAVVSQTLASLTVAVDNVHAPDIRLPRRPGTVTLWRYQGTTASPAVAPPSTAAVQAITGVAEPRLGHPVEAYDAAVRLSSLGVDDLIALLVHPPRPPANELGQWLARTDPAWWVKTVQVWACLGLLHHRSEQPWATSTRRRLLVDIAWGVEDWTTEAALFALVAAAWADPAIRGDVARIVTERLVDLADVNRSRTVTIAWSVATVASRTPGLSEGARELARAIVEANSPEDPADHSAVDSAGERADDSSDHESATPSTRPTARVPTQSTKDVSVPAASGRRRRWFGLRR
jgi:tetratricopeptide (TPR) repeat protein